MSGNSHLRISHFDFKQKRNESKKASEKMEAVVSDPDKKAHWQ